MTDFYDITNPLQIQHPPILGDRPPLATKNDNVIFDQKDDSFADCYQLRLELIEDEANAASEQEAEEIMERRLDADDAVWSAPIRDEQDILTKIDVLRCLVQSMVAAEMLPFIAELQRQVAEFAQAV